jgi:hypothetical protein
MTIGTASGAKLYIGGANADPDTVLATYQADSYVEVGEIEDLGEFGDESTDVTFDSLSRGRTRHLKGTRDAGAMPVVCGDDMTDEGQVAMEAAEATPLDYNFKVTFDNAITIGGTDSEHYFIGKVMSKRRRTGTANNVVRKVFNVGINSAITEVDPT